MSENRELAAYIARAGFTQAGLADSLNIRLEVLTGSPGKLTDRHVRNWLTGKTRWPHAKQRLVLEQEFRCTAVDLGFSPPTPSEQAPSEAPMLRRDFATATASITAASLLSSSPATGLSRVGMSDADRLERNFHELVRADNEGGSEVRLETRALAHAKHALDLQDAGQASTRVRNRLYYLASAFTGTALWAAVDGQEPKRAQRHLQRAMQLAGMAGSSEMQMRLWGHATLLSFQEQHLRDALAAAEAGRRSHACRKDPLYRALANARLGGIQSAIGDERATLRAFDNSVQAYEIADPQAERPSWIGFFDRAELEGLSALAKARLGRHAESEAHLYRALGKLRPEYRRNRTYYGVHLALAQLAQEEVEQACATIAAFLPGTGEPKLSGRTFRWVRKFDLKLSRLAPGSKFAAEMKDRLTEGERKS